MNYIRDEMTLCSLKKCIVPNTNIFIYLDICNLLKVNYSDNTAHCGVEILIKSTLYIQPLSNYCHDHIQSYTIMIKFNNSPITIGDLFFLSL